VVWLRRADILRPFGSVFGVLPIALKVFPLLCFDCLKKGLDEERKDCWNPALPERNAPRNIINAARIRLVTSLLGYCVEHLLNAFMEFESFVSFIFL